MASWLTAQLKSATELLEAVDKTVSRTVGTLGLAEGDVDYVPESAEYGLTRGTPQQNSAPVGYVQPGQQRSPVTSSSGASAGGSSFSQAYGPTSFRTRTAPSNSLPEATRWDAQRTAATSPFADMGAGPARSSGGYPGSAGSVGGGLTGVAGGFTVKADAPIPFGGPVSPSPPSSSIAGLSGSRGPASTFAGVEASGAGSGPGASKLYENGPQAGTMSAAFKDAAVSAYQLPDGAPGGPASAFAPPRMPAWEPATDLTVSNASSKAPPSHTLGFPSGAKPPDHSPPSSGGLPVSGAHAAGAPVTTVHGSSTSAPPAAVPFAAAQPAQPSDSISPTPGGAQEAAAGHRDTDGLRPHAAPVQATPELPSGATGGPAGGPPPQPGVTFAEPSPPSAAQSPQPAPQPPAASVPAASATPSTPAAAASSLASAASAAASTLASTAVTHSLSFFNLVLDDPDGGGTGAAAGAAAGASGEPAAGGSAAAQQVQSLTRMCEQLRKRLEASRLENEQLEDMLARAEVRAQQEAAQVATLREELAGLQQSRTTAEASLSAQLAVARSGLADVSQKYEASQRTVLVLEGQLAALEESSRRLMEQHSDREGGMLEALRAELSSTEARLAAERKAHHATRAAAAAREQDLEQQVAGNTAALADLTRSLEEANRKSRVLEDEVVDASRSRNELADQVTALRRQLEDAGLEPDAGPDDHGADGAGLIRSPPGVGSRRGGAAAAAAAAAELEVLRGELAQHQRAAQLAKQAAEASEAQASRMAEELEELTQALEQRKDTAQLEAQLREVSDMLYLKQTQMERLAAEKAAQQLKTERELESAQQEISKLSRQVLQHGGASAAGRGADGGPSGSSSQTHDVIPMDALGEPYQRLARHNRVGRAVKAAANFLDSTASTTSFALRQYPLARLAVFGYAVLLHLYVYLLIARMQRLATHFEVVTAPADG